jgi:hypothetical protein
MCTPVYNTDARNWIEGQKIWQTHETPKRKRFFLSPNRLCNTTESNLIIEQKANFVDRILYLISERAVCILS